MCFFFFKQKTAYEMRISDWSSDVCSSDLHSEGWEALRDLPDDLHARFLQPQRNHGQGGSRHRGDRSGLGEKVCRPWSHPCAHQQRLQPLAHRSEEHTSELQSLMRISYAVFCLNKKKHSSTCM